MDVFVSDFGFARQKRDSENSRDFTNERVGPVRWEAPESLLRKEYSEKTDVFSFGTTLYEMVCRMEPWSNITTPNVAFKVFNMEFYYFE